jgi:hypothetical protein
MLTRGAKPGAWEPTEPHSHHQSSLKDLLFVPNSVKECLNPLPHSPFARCQCFTRLGLDRPCRIDELSERRLDALGGFRPHSKDLECDSIAACRPLDVIAVTNGKRWRTRGLSHRELP